MQTKIIPRVPEIECYICGDSSTIAVLCHHCGRAMCTQHDSSTLSQKYPFIFRLIDREFTGLNLQEAAGRESGVHCKCCKRFAFLCKLLPSLSLMISLGTISWCISIGLSIWLSASLFVLGVMAVMWSVGAFYRYKKQCSSGRVPYEPSLPIVGKFPEISVTECVTGKITLFPNGLYATEQVRTKGILDFSLQLTEQDRERFDKYRKKHTWAYWHNTPYHAGFVVLAGTNKIYPEDRRTQQINPLTFRDYVHKQPLFNRAGSHTLYNRKWNSSQRYDLLLDKDTIDLPVQIVPTLLSEGEEWALELFVQIKPNQDMSTLSFPRIEKMTLVTPERLGPIESHTPPATISNDVSQQGKVITWKNIELKQVRKTSDHPLTPPATPRENAIEVEQDKKISPHAAFYLRFAGSSDSVARGKVSGHVHVCFEGALSGLKKVSLFFPLGHERVEEVTTHKQTLVKVAFEFHLESLSLRKFYSNEESIEQLTTIPESEVIARLVNAMSDKEMYVQQVIENPPRMNQANAYILNRLWVIAGRRYQAATPIDFRVVAIGQEQYDAGADKPVAGSTRFEIAVRGSIIEEGMRDHINALKKDIIGVIKCTPKLEISLTPGQQLTTQKLSAVTGTIVNKGPMTLKTITIQAEGVEVNRAGTIEELESGEQKTFELFVSANKKGILPVTLMVYCTDQHGQLPSVKQNVSLIVKESPLPPTIYSTNFNGSVTGNIHTGSGDIKP